MQIEISGRYMKLPVTRHCASKNIQFFRDGKLVLDFDCHLDPLEPQQYFYWDLREYLGQRLDMRCVPEIVFVPEFVDEVPMEGVYGERYRPVSHFSASRGWINDPNGMCLYEGKYHVFFQHNPAGPMWGNMTWGHALSDDLLHWKQLEHALLPDEMGTMFSGSAIEDVDNVTGLKNGAHAPLLLFYTAAGDNSTLSRNVKFTQCLAYSLDGGVTFRKYADNPIIPHIIGGNRDPKVIYAPEEGVYYMALYLDGDEYALFTSADLLHWQERQRLHLPGDAECPDFYPLMTGEGKRYWIFTGASDVYLVGRLEYGRFVPVQEPRRLQYRGKAYAAQSFRGSGEYDRFRFSWNQSEIPESLCNGSMCTPNRMTLKEDDEGLWLCTAPVETLEQLKTGRTVGEAAELEAGGCAGLALSGKSQDIFLELWAEQEAEAFIDLLGLRLCLTPRTGQLRVKDITMPLCPQQGKYRLRMITDVHCVEIYGGDGRVFTCVDHMADYTLDRITVKTQGGRAKICAWTAEELQNIWNG